AKTRCAGPVRRGAALRAVARGAPPHAPDGRHEAELSDLHRRRAERRHQGLLARRNYAMAGFNDSSVTIRLPAVTNSIYASTEFGEPKLTDGRGRAVAYELERGIFDFDTSSDEIRMTPKNAKAPVEFAHAVGKLTVKYPLGVKTVTVRKGANK